MTPGANTPTAYIPPVWLMNALGLKFDVLAWPGQSRFDLPSAPQVPDMVPAHKGVTVADLQGHEEGLHLVLPRIGKGALGADIAVAMTLKDCICLAPLAPTLRWWHSHASAALMGFPRRRVAMAFPENWRGPGPFDCGVVVLARGDEATAALRRMAIANQITLWRAV